MRPKWNAPAAAACALVLAAVGACGGGGDEGGAGAESFDSAALAAVETGGAKAQAAGIWSDHPSLPKYAVLQGNNSGTVDIRVGKEPGAIAVNPKTNKIYVTNKKSNTVTVIDGRTNRTKTVKVGPEPIRVKVNTVTNKVYVVNLRGEFEDGTPNPNGSGSVSVIDGATDRVINKVPCELEPFNLAVSERTNKIYVANQGSNDVTVIDGKTNKTKRVQLRPDDADSIYDGVLSPEDIKVNELTDKIYVSGTQSNTIGVIDGKTLKHVVVLTEGGGTTSQSGLTPTYVGVNPKTNQVYTANFTSNDVTQIDGATSKKTGIITLVDVQDPYAMAVNPVTNKIYTANLTSKSITIIDGATKESITIGDLPGKPHDVAINEKTNKIYFPTFVLYRGAQVGDDKQITGVILELDGKTNKLTTIVAGITPYAVAVNPNTNKVYVTNFDAGTVTVLTPR